VLLAGYVVICTERRSHVNNASAFFGTDEVLHNDSPTITTIYRIGNEV